MNILEFNECKLESCNCGFNIKVGGSSEEWEKLRKLLAHNFMLVNLLNKKGVKDDRDTI